MLLSNGILAEMDYYYSLNDPLTTVVTALSFTLVFICIKELVFYVRKTLPYCVKCWFCHYETYVNYKFTNSWVCSQCEQYNGFKKDGDYNKLIDRQYSSKKNISVYAQQCSPSSWRSWPKLCDHCNLKQEIKIQQLASFVPMNEKNYDKEVEHYEKQLEKGFGLCSDCDLLVNKVLTNLREQLSLPKRLTTAVSKINIRGERAICINIALSLLFALSSIKYECNLLYEIPSLQFNERIVEYWDLVINHPGITVILANRLQILMGTGIFINSIGFYQTLSSEVLLNMVSWTLMFILTLYPDGFEQYVNILKIASSLVSITVSVLLLLKNRKKNKRKKLSSWEKTKTMKDPTLIPCDLISSLPTPQASSSPKNEPNTNLSTSKFDESTCSISSSFSNLSLGIKSRRTLKPTNVRPVVTPPKFNPFNKTTSERSYKIYGKPGSFSYNACDTSFTPPPLYDSLGSPEPITTIPSYNCQQPFYPCSNPFAYYFNSQHCPKVMSFPGCLPQATLNFPVKEKNYLWVFIQIIPTVVLIIGNFIILYTIYVKPNDALRN